MADKAKTSKGAGAAPTADSPAAIRNVVLVGPSGGGKTTLVEGLLVASGGLTRPGSGGDGPTGGPTGGRHGAPRRVAAGRLRGTHQTRLRGRRHHGLRQRRGGDPPAAIGRSRARLAGARRGQGQPDRHTRLCRLRR